MTWKAAFNELRDHLQTLANPYAAEPIIKHLKSAFDDWDHAQPIRFEGFVCSEQTTSVLEQFSAEIYEARSVFTDRKVREDVVAKVTRVSEAILGRVQEKKDQYAEEHLKILLESPTARRLTDEKIQQLFNNLSKRSAWRSFAKQTFCDEEFDAYLKTNYPKYSQYNDPQANFITQVYKNRSTVSPQNLQQNEQEKSNKWQLELTNKQSELQCYWLRDENRDLLLQLIACHVKGEAVNIEDKEEAVELVSAVVGLNQKLNLLITKEEVVIKALKSAYHTCFLKKGEDFVIGNALELMQEAYQHNEESKGKEAILFAGNTKGGKSTSIAYFLGAQLKKEKGLLKIEEGQRGLPAIGGSYGISQTLYTRAYTAATDQLENTVLLDSGGINDSRGKDHELCVHLSLDLTVQNVSKIKAIVLVIPFDYFSMSSNGRDALELVLATSERFPGLWESDGVHVLVTHAEDKSTGDIEDGARFTAFADAVREQIKKQISGENREALSQKLKVWELLSKLSEKNRVNVFDFEDEDARVELLNGYKAGSTDLKEGYAPFLLTEHGREKFEKPIEQYMDAWTDLIRGYLSIPNQIDLQSENIESMQDNVKLLEKMIDLFDLVVGNLDEMKSKLQNIVDLCDQEQYKDVLTRIKEGFFDELAKDSQEVGKLLDEASGLDRALQTSINEVKDKDSALSEQRHEREVGVFASSVYLTSSPTPLLVIALMGGSAAALGPVGWALGGVMGLPIAAAGIYVLYKTMTSTAKKIEEAKEELREQMNQFKGSLVDQIDSLTNQQEKCEERIAAVRESIKEIQDTDIPVREQHIDSLEEKQQNLENLFACEDKTLNILSAFSKFILSLDHSENESEFTKCYREFREIFAKLKT